jgi:NADPH-dependent curcumin reductase CurA
MWRNRTLQCDVEDRWSIKLPELDCAEGYSFHCFNHMLGRMEGLIVFDYASKYEAAVGRLAEFKAEGKLVQKVTVVPGGLEKAPEALNALFVGANTGKMIVQVSSEKEEPKL